MVAYNAAETLRDTATLEPTNTEWNEQARRKREAF
jgi:hypothetical protein